MFAWNGYRPLTLIDGKFMRILPPAFGILLLLAFLGKTWGQEPFPRESHEARIRALEAEITHLREQLRSSQRGDVHSNRPTAARNFPLTAHPCGPRQS